MGRKVSVRKSTDVANRPVEGLIRPADTWVTKDERAKFGRFTASSAGGLRVQDCQSDGKMDRQIRQRFNSRTHAPRVHFTGRDHYDITLAREAFCAAAPERSRSAENQSERVGIVAMPRKCLRLVCRSHHFNALAES